MERVSIKLDKEMILDELYKLKPLIEENKEEAEKKLMEIIALVYHAPVNTSQTNWPGIKARHG